MLILSYAIKQTKLFTTKSNLEGLQTYNPGHDILELYNILVKIRFTTSKTKLDIQCSKLGTGVVEQLKTQVLRELEYIRKISNFEGTPGLVPSLPSRTLPIAVKKNAKTDTKLFFSCPILMDDSIFFQIFCTGLQFLIIFFSPCSPNCSSYS